MPMIDMKKGSAPTDEDYPAGAPEYSYGLKVTLDDEELKKLMMKQMPSVGDELNMHAMVKVVEVGEETEKGSQEKRRLVLQITKLGLFADKKDDSDKFYGA